VTLLLLALHAIGYVKIYMHGEGCAHLALPASDAHIQNTDKHWQECHVTVSDTVGSEPVWFLYPSTEMTLKMPISNVSSGKVKPAHAEA
jgi:hypothetical protein